MIEDGPLVPGLRDGQDPPAFHVLHRGLRIGKQPRPDDAGLLKRLDEMLLEAQEVAHLRRPRDRGQEFCPVPPDQAGSPRDRRRHEVGRDVERRVAGFRHREHARQEGRGLAVPRLVGGLQVDDHPVAVDQGARSPLPRAGLKSDEPHGVSSRCVLVGDARRYGSLARSDRATKRTRRTTAASVDRSSIRSPDSRLTRSGLASVKSRVLVKK